MVGGVGLFDTNILIDHLNGFPQARVEFDRYAVRAISIITWMEVMAGIDSANEDRTRTLLQSFVIIQINGELAERAAKIRRQTRLKLPDAIILATAEQQNMTLITRNTRDFGTTHPRVHIPYTR